MVWLRSGLRFVTSRAYHALPLFKPIGSAETWSRDSRAPREGIVLTWRNIIEDGEGEE